MQNNKAVNRKTNLFNQVLPEVVEFQQELVNREWGTKLRD